MSGKLTAVHRPFRILALPLARLPRPIRSSPAASSTPSAPSSAQTDAPHAPTTSSSAATPLKPANPLMLFQVTQPDPPPEAGPPNIAQRALTKASDTWLKLGDKPKDSWMHWFYARGEKLMDRIEYEEWMLKAIQEDRGVKIAKKEGETQEKIEIPLLHPTLKEQPLPPLLPKLHRLLIHRIPHHKKLMYRFLIFSPVTWPFAIIPIVPNFPLFYVLWRAWSHYKAWRGALYLENLLKLGMIVEKPSEQLDEIYTSQGVVVGPEGGENVAPDTTSSDGVKKGARGPIKGAPATTAAAEETSAEGKEEIAPDATTTPATQVFHAQAGKHKHGKHDSPHADPTVRPAGLLLGRNQVPLLSRAFSLKPNEIVDVNRAVEQAESRLRAVEQKNVEVKAEEEGKMPPKTEWKGNLHR